MASAYSGDQLGPGSNHNFSNSMNMLPTTSSQAPGWNQTSKVQANQPQPQHAPPPLPTDGAMSPQPRRMMQVQPPEIRETQYNPEDTYQMAQSYKAYSPQAVAVSSRQHSRSPSMSDLAQQNAELRKQLKQLRVECDRRIIAVDDMLTAVLEAEGQVAEKEAEVHRLSAELDQNTPQSSKMEALFKNQQAGSLAVKDQQINALQQEVQRLSTTNTNNNLVVEKHTTELSDLRQKSLKLHELLSEKDDLLRKMTIDLKAWESGWKAHLQKEKANLEANFEAKYALSETDLRNKTARLEAAEAQSRAADLSATTALAQVDAQKAQAETYLQQLTDLQRSHATLSEQLASKPEIDGGVVEKLQAELTEARKLGAYFKKNVDQASKTSKEVAAANRALQDSLMAKTREVEEQASLIHAMRLQSGDVQMLG